MREAVEAVDGAEPPLVLEPVVRLDQVPSPVCGSTESPVPMQEPPLAGSALDEHEARHNTAAVQRFVALAHDHACAICLWHWDGDGKRWGLACKWVPDTPPARSAPHATPVERSLWTVAHSCRASPMRVGTTVEWHLLCGDLRGTLYAPNAFASMHHVPPLLPWTANGSQTAPLATLSILDGWLFVECHRWAGDVHGHTDDAAVRHLIDRADRLAATAHTTPYGSHCARLVRVARTMLSPLSATHEGDLFMEPNRTP